MNNEMCKSIAIYVSYANIPMFVINTVQKCYETNKHHLTRSTIKFYIKLITYRPLIWHQLF